MTGRDDKNGPPPAAQALTDTRGDAGVARGDDEAKGSKTQGRGDSETDFR